MGTRLMLGVWPYINLTDPKLLIRDNGIILLLSFSLQV